ncbi:MAG TPA: flagellar hook-length control protein FliK [Pseudolabrys sp.]|nr:flagellar hook-length control protein FliK [Pseudolabrys sp.]
MPHVASDSSAQALKPLLAPSARPSFSPDRAASSTPFDSLVDDSLPPPAPESRARPADDTPPPRADRDPPKSADRPDPPAKSADASQSENPAQDAAKDAVSSKAQDGKDASDAKDAKDTKKAKDPKDTDKAGDAAKSTEADATAVTVTQAAPVQTPVAAAIAVATMQTTAATADAGKAADATINAAKAQQGEPDLLAALQAKIGGKADGKIDGKAADKPADKADKKADTGKANAAKTAAATPAALDAAAKAQANGEPDKTSAEHAHAETVADIHRGVSADAQVKPAPDDQTAAPKLTADIAQPTVPPAPPQTAQAPAAAAPTANVQAPNSQTAVPIAGVGIEIASKALSGKNHFDIRLDPPDLGHIHVRLEVDKDGNVISHMVADRTDTLDLLRRDTAGLERALNDAGLKTSDNSLQFSLRDQSAGQQQSDNGGRNAAHIVVDDPQAPTIAVARDYSRYGARAGGLDIRV